MGNKRIGTDADDFVEKIQGEKVAGHGATDRTEKGQCEAGVEAGLGVFLKGAHVACRVEDGQNPQ